MDTRLELCASVKIITAGRPHMTDSMCTADRPEFHYITGTSKASLWLSPSTACTQLHDGTMA